MAPPSDSILAYRSAVRSMTPPCRLPPETSTGRHRYPPVRPPGEQGRPAHARIDSVKKSPVKCDKLAWSNTRMDTRRRGFPETRWSLVLRAGSETTEASRAALDEL